MREVVFDTETTGLNPQTGDRLVEIGCVELVHRVETGRVFHAYVNPERAMDSVAYQVHGLSDTFLASKPVFSEIVEDLLDFLGESPLVAHNAQFDFMFLNHELGACGRLHMPMARMVCTAQLARTRHPGAKHSLDALCTRFGIDRSHRVKHGALLDAQLLAQVYVELTGGRQIGLGLAEDVHASIKPVADNVRAQIFYAPRPHSASSAERERHRLFLQRLTDPLWLDVAAAALKSESGVTIDEVAPPA